MESLVLMFFFCPLDSNTYFTNKAGLIMFSFKDILFCSFLNILKKC
jgi:hypothetical protein